MAVAIDLSVVWSGLRVAVEATVVSVVLGLWLAWLLANRRFPGRRELGWLASAALALPAPVICYYFLAGRAAFWPGGITAAATVAATPAVVRTGRSVLAALNPQYGQAARSLGASDWRIFWRVELPLIVRPALAAAALAFTRVLGELAATVLIAARFVR